MIGPICGRPITRHHNEMTIRRFRHWIASWFMGAGALLFLIEEWLWNRLKQAMALLGRLPGLRQLERRIAGLPPAWAAVVFLAPSALILPVKLFAVTMIAKGHIVSGGGVILGAKITATALFSRVYVLTHPALMRVRWFTRLHATVLRWRVWVHREVEARPLWRAGRRVLLRWRAEVEARYGRGGRWARRLAAARRLDRIRRRTTSSTACLTPEMRD
jgi:hypothetical protein